MSWIKGFYDGKRKKPSLSKTSPHMIDLLPPIQEYKAFDPEKLHRETPVRKRSGASLERETPVKKRSAEQRRVKIHTGIEVSGYSVQPQLQWTPLTPKTQRKEEVHESEHDSDLESDEEFSGYSMQETKVQKKHKLESWANSPDGDLPDQSFEEWLEEEEKQQPRKKLRLSYP
ncbi:MAG: hypothetical protein Q9221_000997 [Calogaya cf. arnoldii]